MFSKAISKIIKKKNLNCLIITPPLMEPNTFYTASPILTGQLLANGFYAKNLDLNIKFFRKILTKEYINKTKKILSSKKITYDKKEVNYLTENIDKSIKIYREGASNGITFQKSEEVINTALRFIAKPYKCFKLSQLKNFEECYAGYNYNWESIKKISLNKEANIFIDFFEQIIKEIKKQHIDFIGITIPFPGNIIPALTLSRLLKKRTKIYVTLGGNFIKKEHIYNHPEILDIYCDSVLIGDGEISIVELANALKNNTNLNDVNGIIYKNNKKEIIQTESKPIKNINTIANVSLDGLNFEEYMANNPTIQLINSKGCYWGKCTFCSLAAKYSKYCIKTPHKIISNIKELKEKINTLKYISFQDDAIHPNYLDKLADEIIKENLNIQYSIFGRFEKEFTRDLLQKLYKSGLRSIYWGLESGSQKILNDMNKGINLENVARILKDANEIGIENMVGIIVNFPTETTKEYNETLEFLSKIKQYATISPGRFAIMKNSIIAKNADKYGVKALGAEEFSYCIMYKNNNISEEEEQQKWEYFCECIRKSDFHIDSNKNI